MDPTSQAPEPTLFNHSTKQPLLDPMPRVTRQGGPALGLSAWLTGPSVLAPGSDGHCLLLPDPQEYGQLKDLHPPLCFAGSHLGWRHPQPSYGSHPWPKSHH